MKGGTPHVVMVTGEYPPAHGGVGDYTRCLQSALQHSGVRVSIVTAREYAGANVPSVPAWDVRAISTIASCARTTGANLVHVQYQSGAFQMRPTVNLLPAILRRILNLPVVTTFHDLRAPYLFPMAGSLRDRAITQMARDSTAVVVTNPADARALSARSIASVQIPIAPNVPIASVGVTAPGDHIAFFGLPTRSKGIFELLDAVARVDTVYRPELTLVGAEGNPSGSNDIVPKHVLERLARFRQVTLNWTGFVSPERAAVELAHAQSIILPFREGASMRSGSLLAALQSWRPVITTAPARMEDLGSLRSLRQLRIVPPGDPQALATAIEYVGSEPFSADKLPPEFTWHSIAEQHAELYIGILRMCDS